MLITSFFTNNGIPAIGLSPSIRIWNVTSLLNDLVIGFPNGSSLAVDGVMTAIVDAPSDDGFYIFDFTTILGFNPTFSYVVRTDGGVTLTNSERFQSITFTPDSMDEPQSIHSITGSVGASISNLTLDVNDIQAMVELLLKYDTNRTRIDTVAKTLTVLDDDCVTPLRVFKLLDSTGNPSVTDVCERKPISATDGLPVCP